MDCQVLVIGAGAVGASAAYELASRGVDVTVIDQRPAPGEGCSFANAGLLVPSRMEPLTTPTSIKAGLSHLLDPAAPFHLAPRPAIVPWLLRFALASLPSASARTTQLLRAMASESFEMHVHYAMSGLGTSFQRKGFLDAFHTSSRLETARESIDRNTWSMGARYIGAADATAMVPGAPGLAGGIYYPQEGHCDSHTYVAALMSAAVSQGAKLSTGTTVERLHTEGRTISRVETSSGDIVTPTIVLAAGDGSRKLARQIGIRTPIEPGKGYVIDLESSTDDPEMPIGVRELKIAITPYRDKLRVAGTLELAGKNSEIDGPRAKAVHAAGIKTLPVLTERRILSTWAGMRPCSPDGKPLIGRSQRYKNLIFATGHGPDGIILAPITGRLVAETYEAAPGHRKDVLKALSPDRFEYFPRLPWP